MLPLGEKHHALLDHAVARIKSDLHGFRFYEEGWGGQLPDLLPSTARSLLAAAQSPTRAGQPAPLARLELMDSPHGSDSVLVAEGSFDSPGDVRLLPSPSLRARFQVVAPAAAVRAGRPLPVVVLLPGTGEQGFRRRRHCVSYPLATAGIASVILEGPLYGSRRPRGQAGTKLRTFADLLGLGLTTIAEAAALVGWLRGTPPSLSIEPCGSVPEELGAPDSLSARLRTGQALCGVGSPVVLAGVSMGGLHAAMAASALPPALSAGLGVVSWLGPPSAAPVFALGALAGGVDWAALAAGAKRDAPLGRALEAGLLGMEAELGAAAAPPSWRGHVQDVDVAEAWQSRARSALADPGLGLPLPPAQAAAAQGLMHTHAAAAENVLLPTHAAGSHPGGAGSSDPPAWLAGLPRLPSRAAPPTAASLLLSPADFAHARRQLARASAVTELSNFPPPARPDAAIFTLGCTDLYVPATPQTARTWEHVRQAWAGCDVRQVRGGHVSAAVFCLDTFLGTLKEVVQRLTR